MIRYSEEKKEKQAAEALSDGTIVRGTIVKGIAGFYYVDTGSAVYECKARGVFKNTSIKPYVGDEVKIDLSADTPVVREICERKNVFERPPVANVEQFVFVSALKSPDPNFAVIDRFLTAAEKMDVDVVICFNKADLADEEIRRSAESVYGDIYPVVFSDACSGRGVERLRPFLKDRKSALAGTSGVGKSTILNNLIRDAGAETGSISEKTNRGRHTTRHVELFRLEGGGMIFDTPGFMSFDLPVMEDTELPYLFREFDRYAGECRFHGCLHRDEPGCAVKEAAALGKISQSRYHSYLMQLKELGSREKKEQWYRSDRRNR